MTDGQGAGHLLGSPEALRPEASPYSGGLRPRRMRSHPSSGKALSTRPQQMRGVLRLGRATNLWPT